MAWDTTTDRAAMLGEFCGDGELLYSQRSVAGTSPTINCKTGETGVAKSIPLLDDAGEPLGLSDWGDKVLVIERATQRGDVQVVEEGDGLVIGGDDGNEFTFTPSATVLERAADFKWSLREQSSQEVIASGRLAVAYSPLEDTP